ncbi:hypothetical protein [Pleomorphovibrio marinus]|uniref:hypothetical protein n=1 Tax=Pleomorphovibrio marinus TaxID=2164132 RepID=UPI000E09FC3D|nr:hypothetical protein [Pleomorphovibrio marinus]
MGWTEFIKYLASGYLLYYGILIVLDLLKPQKGALIMGEEDLLEFPEDTQTTVVEEEEVTSYGASPSGVQLSQGEQLKLYGENINVSTGGVSSMTELFRLAHDETIEVKKQLVY